MSYCSEERVVREHGRREEGDQREQNRAQQQLIDVVIPRVKPIPKYVESLPYDRSEPTTLSPRGDNDAHRGTDSIEILQGSAAG